MSARLRRSARRPWLVGASLAVVALVLLPLAFLFLQSANSGWSHVWRLLWRHLTLTLLWNTVQLAVVVTVASAVVGTGAAWATERTRLPARRALAALVVLPVAIPDFVVASGWVSLFPSLHGLLGASIVLTLGLYPLVYLPVAASLRSSDAAQEEVARSLGLGPWRTFFRVTLHQVRVALLGGCLLVALYLLAEFGAFSILRFQTFTTEIYAEILVGFDPAAGAALSLVLVVLGIAVLAGEWAAGSGSQGSRAGLASTRPRSTARSRLGRAKLPLLAAVGILVALGVGVPVGAIVYWLVAEQRTTLPGAASLASAAWHTFSYSAVAAALASVIALPVAILSVRRRSRLALALERAGMLVQAIPGLVVAFALVYFSVRYARFAYQSAALLVVGYSVMFFPLALVAVRASLARVPPRLEEIGRSLGLRPTLVLVRVTVPLVLPGLLAGFFLVFLTATTELAATLLLVPNGVQTLATQFWADSAELAYGAAAPFAAVMLAVAVVPTYLLSRWFDRLPSRRARPA